MCGIACLQARAKPSASTSIISRQPSTSIDSIVVSAAIASGERSAALFTSDVEAPEPVHRLGDEPFDVGRLAEVEGDRGRSDRVRDGLRAGRVDVGHDHPRALGRELAARRRPDAAGAAGDDRDLPVEARAHAAGGVAAQGSGVSWNVRAT